MTPERADEIAYQLLGTCRSIEEFLEDGEDQYDKVLTDAIDSSMFCCDVCGWWCETCEANVEESTRRNNDVCTDCCPGDD